MGVDFLGGLGVEHAFVHLKDAEVEHAAVAGFLVGAHHLPAAAGVHDGGHAQAGHLAAAVVDGAYPGLVVALGRVHRDQPHRVAEEHPCGDLHFARLPVHRQRAHLAEDLVLIVEPVQVLEPPVGPGGGVGVVDAHQAEGGGVDRDTAVHPAEADRVVRRMLVDLPAGEGPLVLVLVPAAARDPLAGLGVEAVHQVGDQLHDLAGAHRVAQVVLELRLDAQLGEMEMRVDQAGQDDTPLHVGHARVRPGEGEYLRVAADPHDLRAVRALAPGDGLRNREVVVDRDDLAVVQDAVGADSARGCPLLARGRAEQQHAREERGGRVGSLTRRAGFRAPG